MNVSVSLIVLLLLVVFAVVVVVKTIRIVPQQTALIIERLGRYSRTLHGGIHILVPFVDKVRANIDLREQVVSFPPQPVITSDNLVVSIDTVIYYAVHDAKSAVYEIANFIQGIEQLTVTTLRNVIGSMDLEQALTSRDQINGQLRGVLDEATGRWGIRVGRVELKAIDPPHSVQDSMEKQMRAERDRRAAILTAEGVKQSAILTAEGDKQSQILRAEGSAQARILEAQGQARAISQVFDAIHRGKPDQKLLAYQYLQVLPQLARGDANKMWIVPGEFTEALKGFGASFGGGSGASSPFAGIPADEEWTPDTDQQRTAFDDTALQDPHEALAQARDEAARSVREAEGATQATRRRGGAPAPASTAGADAATAGLAGRGDEAALEGAPPVPATSDPVPTEAPVAEPVARPVTEPVADPASAPATQPAGEGTGGATSAPPERA
ncbi:SPFH domain-containing protein [Agilicoccus flavus]|uniref:SPFH domain-containing protein n=1 Tax=Agilicoccus flavus TaxID=2775968 RepID=UPI001CF71709|nr:SPFH domain-containing protein [Agilicoccus flavus]